MITENFIKENTESARQELAEHGYAIFNRVYDENFIEKAKAMFDLPEADDRSESVHFGSEKRIWGAEHISPLAADFMSQSDAFLSAILEKQYLSYSIMGQKIKQVDQELANNAKSRWHIDSMSSQYKIFCYLSEAGRANGGLEFLEGTDGDYKWRLVCKNPSRFVNFKMLFNKKSSRPYECLDSEYIERLKASYPVKTVTVPPGSILVAKTSSLIHRARPCESGYRYSLTSYYR